MCAGIMLLSYHSSQIKDYLSNVLISKIIKYFIAARVQFMRYIVVGATSFIGDFLFMIYLKEYLNFQASLATIVSQFVAVLFVFFANKFWSFGVIEKTKQQAARFLLILLVNYTYTVLTVYVFSDIAGFDYRLVRILAMVLMVSWNFVLYKEFIWSKVSKGEQV